MNDITWTNRQVTCMHSRVIVLLSASSHFLGSQNRCFCFWMVVITELCDKTCGLDARAGSYGQGIVLSTKALRELKTAKRVFPVFFFYLLQIWELIYESNYLHNSQKLCIFAELIQVEN